MRPKTDTSDQLISSKSAAVSVFISWWWYCQRWCYYRCSWCWCSWQCCMNFFSFVFVFWRFTSHGLIFLFHPEAQPIWLYHSNFCNPFIRNFKLLNNHFYSSFSFLSIITCFCLPFPATLSGRSIPEMSLLLKWQDLWQNYWLILSIMYIYRITSWNCSVWFILLGCQHLHRLWSFSCESSSICHHFCLSVCRSVNNEFQEVL